ncbi:MAG: hypothetical protein ACK463_33965, partial [Bradyrhizobium sp.]
LCVVEEIIGFLGIVRADARHHDRKAVMTTPYSEDVWAGANPQKNLRRRGINFWFVRKSSARRRFVRL